MRGSVWCVATVCALLASSHLVTAQNPGAASAAERATPTLEPALRADIERLMEMTGQANLGAQMATTMSDAMLNNFRQTQKRIPPRVIDVVREVSSEEFARAFASSAIKEKQIALFAKYYTHAEIKGLIAFYETDLGRKAIANTPHLMREGAAIGEEWAREAMPGVMKLIEARLRSEGLIP